MMTLRRGENLALRMLQKLSCMLSKESRALDSWPEYVSPSSSNHPPFICVSLKGVSSYIIYQWIRRLKHPIAFFRRGLPLEKKLHNHRLPGSFQEWTVLKHVVHIFRVTRFSLLPLQFPNPQSSILSVASPNTVQMFEFQQHFKRLVGHDLIASNVLFECLLQVFRLSRGTNSRSSYLDNSCIGYIRFHFTDVRLLKVYGSNSSQFFAILL